MRRPTAEDFCNGSRADDMATLDLSHDVETTIDTLVSEAIRIQDEINAAQPDDASDIDESEFREYYERLALEARL